MIFKVMLFYLDNIYYEKVVVYIEIINFLKLFNRSILFLLREGGLNYGIYV